MERAERYRVYDYIRIYDKEFNLIREISEYNSLIFTENAEGIGEFELHLREKDVDIESFGHYMKVGNDLSLVGIIEYEYWNGDGFDQESAEDYTVKGYTLMGLLANRIILPEVWSTTGYRHYNAPIEDIIYDLIDSQCIHSTYKERNIPYLHIPQSRHRGKTITADYRNNSLVETLQELISQTNLYFQFEMRPKEKGLWLWILEGDDHRSGEDKYIISKRYDRVQEETYEHSALGTKNYAYVYGEGDGAERELVKVYRDSENEYKEDIDDNAEGIPSSIDRREVYIDARDVQSDDVANEEVTGEEVDEDELKRKTRQVLFDRGVEKLNELRETASLEFVASPDEYGTCYNLGDMLLYRNEETGTTQEGKVVEVTHTFEGASHTVVVTCGHSKTTILSAITNAANDATVERTGISAKFKDISADFANFEQTVTDQLLAQNASIGELWADVANLDILKVTEMLEATQAEIDKLRAEWAGFDTVEITNQLTALSAEFENFEATYGNVDQLFANYFSAHKITGDMIEAGTITVDHLVTKTITRDWIADGTITADQIMDSAITGDKLVEGTITGIQIQDGSISAEKLQANSITGDQIMANSIDASKLVAGSITAELLALDALMSRNYRANGDNSEVYEGTFINMTDGSIHTTKLQIDGLTGDATFSGNLRLKQDSNWISFYSSDDIFLGDIAVWANEYGDQTGFNITSRDLMKLEATNGMNIGLALTTVGDKYTGFEIQKDFITLWAKDVNLGNWEVGRNIIAYGSYIQLGSIDSSSNITYTDNIYLNGEIQHYKGEYINIESNAITLEGQASINIGTNANLNPSISIGHYRSSSISTTVNIDGDNTTISAGRYLTLGATNEGDTDLLGNTINIQSGSGNSIKIGTYNNPAISIGSTSNTNTMQLYSRYIYLGSSTNSYIYARGSYVNIDSGNINSYVSTPDTTSVIQKIYPVGSIYISTKSTNPRTVLGFGYWSQIASRYYLMTAGNGIPSDTLDGLSNHNHTQTMSFRSGYVNGNGLKYTEGDTIPGGVQYTGNSEANPTYYSVYVFRRDS